MIPLVENRLEKERPHPTPTGNWALPKFNLNLGGVKHAFSTKYACFQQRPLIIAPYCRIPETKVIKIAKKLLKLYNISIMPLPKPEDITYISPDELPDSVAEHLIDRAVYLGHTSINYISDFGRFMKLEDPDGYSIFFSMADHSYPISDTKDTLERRIYAVDSIEREQVVGYGGVSSSLTSQTDFALNKPLVLGIETYGGFRERGFGRRRYLGMNAASLLMFGLPIHSREKGHMLSDLATRRWEAFVQEGLAEAYEQVLDFPPGRKIQRYRFKA